MADAVMRQIEMLRLLPRQGKVTPQQLHQQLVDLGYPTTERTIQRDLQALSAAFPLECDDKSKPHGWRWHPATPASNLPGLSLSESLAFQMLEKFGVDLLPASIVSQLQNYFVAARAQLAQEVGPVSAKNWLKKIRSVPPSQPLLPATVSVDVLKAVHSALMQERCLRIRYRSPKAKDHVLHPLGLVQHGHCFYLVVNFDGYPDVRLLAVHRIREAAVLDQPARSPVDFDLDRFIGEGGMGFGEVGETVKIRLRMVNYAADHLKETRLSKDQAVTDLAPGEAEVEATVQLTRRLRWWLLSFGSDLEVLGPPSLRSEIGDCLSQAANRYRSPQ
jgi:predicted DNA-binding transcriptional regulator YafY